MMASTEAPNGEVGWLVVLPVLLGALAFAVTFRLRNEAEAARPRKPARALVLGLATAALGYTALAAATFVPGGLASSLRHAVEISRSGTALIGGLSSLTLALALVIVGIGRRWSAQASELRTLVEDSAFMRENLAQTEERLRLAVRSSGLIVWNWEIAEDLLEADENSGLLFGVAPERFPRTMAGFELMVHPDDRERIRGEIRAALAGAVYDTEFRVLWPDGSVRSVAVRGQVYFDGQGAPQRLSGVTWDVTERRRTEESLRATAERLAAEAKFRELLEAAPDAVAVMNSESSIVLVNTQLERLFGYGREELLGQSFATLVPERLRDETALYRGDLLADSLERDTGAGLEMLARRKDGSEFPTEVRLSPLETGEGVLISSAIRDITDRKQVEGQILELNRRLEEAAAQAGAANRAKSTFLSTVSHEIRTPMNAILGYAQLLQRDPTLGAEAQASLQIIGRSGEQLLALINDVLDMSKIEAGRVELHPSAFDPAVLLADLEAMFHLRAEGKSLEFTLYFSGEAGRLVIADEAKIRQTLINLLGNAIKFTAAGSVCLRASLRERNGEDWLSFQVEDTGPGIAKEEQARLFEPFRQAKEGVERGDGTGLGLAISRNFARLMGGDVTLESQPGLGSIFRFAVPVERGRAPVETARLTADGLRRLPADLLEALGSAIQSGNKRLMDEAIGRVRAARGPAFAGLLQELADKYEYDLLTERLEEARAR